MSKERGHLYPLSLACLRTCHEDLQTLAVHISRELKDTTQIVIMEGYEKIKDYENEFFPNGMGQKYKETKISRNEHTKIYPSIAVDIYTMPPMTIALNGFYKWKMFALFIEEEIRILQKANKIKHDILWGGRRNKKDVLHWYIKE